MVYCFLQSASYFNHPMKAAALPSEAGNTGVCASYVWEYHLQEQRTSGVVHCRELFYFPLRKLLRNLKHCWMSGTRT